MIFAVASVLAVMKASVRPSNESTASQQKSFQWRSVKFRWRTPSGQSLVGPVTCDYKNFKLNSTPYIVNIIVCRQTDSILKG